MEFDRTKGEEQLELADMQGDALVGLQKDYQQFIDSTISDTAAFKVFARNLTPTITTAKKVFERELQLQAQKKNGTKTRFEFIGVNISFTFTGLQQLIGADAALVQDPAFREGLNASRSAALNDLLAGPGSPAMSKVGGVPIHSMVC